MKRIALILMLVCVSAIGAPERQQVPNSIAAKKVLDAAVTNGTMNLPTGAEIDAEFNSKQAEIMKRIVNALGASIEIEKKKAGKK